MCSMSPRSGSGAMTDSRSKVNAESFPFLCSCREKKGLQGDYVLDYKVLTSWSLAAFLPVGKIQDSCLPLARIIPSHWLVMKKGYKIWTAAPKPTFILPPQVPHQQGEVTVAGGDQSLHPALLSLAVPRCKPVGFESRPLEHQGEGKLYVGLRAPDRAPLQHDDPQQVTVPRTLLVEEQVGLQDEPAAAVGGVSLFLRGEFVKVKPDCFMSHPIGSSSLVT